MDYRELVNLFEKAGARTPAYIFDAGALKERMEMIRRNLEPGTRLCFAVKANPFLAQAMRGLADCFEICSPGEERICERAGVPAGEMVLSGVNKEEEDFRRAAEYAGKSEGRPVCTIESAGQAEMLNRIMPEGTEVLIRVTSGNQFGVDEETAVQLVREREKYPNLRIRGLQLYSGTQKKKLHFLEEEIGEIDRLLERLETECGFRAEEFEYGPGLYVPYFVKDGESDDPAVLRELNGYLQAMKRKGRITLEMGRFLTAYCGIYASRIMEIKKNCGVNYCILDGGIHQVNYYGQMLAMKMPHMLTKDCSPDAPAENYDLCGSLCTVSDVLVREVPLQSPQTGDILFFKRTGAYSVTEGISLFLSRDLPEVWLLENGNMKQSRANTPTEKLNYGRTD